MATVVADTSPLIALHQIGQLLLLQSLFGEVSVPPAVLREAAPSLRDRPVWIVGRELGQPIGPDIVRASLGSGESEALALALELKAGVVIVDERPARRLAVALGLAVVGTAGILVRAKKAGFIPGLVTLYEIRLATYCDREYEGRLNLVGSGSRDDEVVHGVIRRPLESDAHDAAFLAKFGGSVADQEVGELRHRNLPLESHSTTTRRVWTRPLRRRTVLRVLWPCLAVAGSDCHSSKCGSTCLKNVSSAGRSLLRRHWSNSCRGISHS